jgi:four helix bundle protein
MQDYKKLKVWEKSNLLTIKIYKITASFPKHELYGITSQLRRASVSVPTNIAEGCGRDSKAEFCHFLQIAAGSASEVEYLVELSYQLKYLKEDKYKELSLKIVEIKKMLRSFIKKLKTNN